MELGVALRIFKSIGKMNVVGLGHLVLPSGEVDIERIGGFGTFDFDLQFKILILECGECIVLYFKRIGSWFSIKFVVMYDSFGRLGENFASYRKDDDTEKDRDESPFDVAAGVFEGDGLDEGEGFDFLDFGVDGGSDEFRAFAFTLFAHRLQLEEVEQFVVNFGEMLADDGRYLCGGELFTHAEDFKEGDDDVKDEGDGEDGEVGEEEDGADGGVEVGEIFEQGIRDEHHQGDDDEDECAAQEFVEVVLVDELSDFLPNNLLIICHFRCSLVSRGYCRRGLVVV